MLDILTATWSPSTTWDELVDLCARVTVLRTEIRQSRGIKAPLMRCPSCGGVSRADIKGVSVRSALFALRKLGTLPEADFRRLDGDWKKHRAARKVDALGRERSVPSVTTSSDPSDCC